jgi:hypothetical protein
MTNIADTPIAALMAKDPLNHTDQDIDTIVSVLREQRHRFVGTGDKAVGKPEARKGATQKAKDKASDMLKNVDIDDLLAGI